MNSFWLYGFGFFGFFSSLSVFFFATRFSNVFQHIRY